MKIRSVIIRKYIDDAMAFHNYFWSSKPLNKEEITTRISAIQNLPVKGIIKDGRKWYASIKFNKEEYKLGGYYNEDDAIKIRLKKELELYGTFDAPQSYLFNKYLNIIS